MPVEIIPGGEPLLGPEARQNAADRLGQMFGRQAHDRPGAPAVGTTVIPSQEEQNRRDATLAGLDGAESYVVRGRSSTGIDDGDGYGMAPAEEDPESPRAQLDREDRGWRVLGRVSRMIQGR